MASPLPFACVTFRDFPAWAFVRSSRPPRDVLVVRRDRVIAATAQARRAGVTRGMSAERARLLVPKAVVHARDPQLEQAAWEAALEVLLGVAPALEAATVGTAFLGRPDPDRLRAAVARLGATAAAASDRETARLGAARAAAGHTLSVAPADRGIFLARFSVEHLDRIGFSAELGDALRRFGYPVLADVARLTRRQLTAQFGRDGERLFGLLHPDTEQAPVPLYHPPPTITASVDLDPPCTEAAELLPAVDYLVKEAACSLDTVHARRLTVRAEGTDGPRAATRILPEATRSSAMLTRAARTLLLDLLRSPAPLDRLSVELGGLAPASLEQGALFERRRPVYLAIRGVHRRFPGAIKRAIIVSALFPEDAARYEPFPEPTC